MDCGGERERVKGDSQPGLGIAREVEEVAIGQGGSLLSEQGEKTGRRRRARERERERKCWKEKEKEPTSCVRMRFYSAL